MPLIEFKCEKPAEVDQVRTIVRDVCERRGMSAVYVYPMKEPGQIQDLYIHAESTVGHVSFYACPDKMLMPSLLARSEVVKQVNERLPRKIGIRGLFKINNSL